MKKRKWLSLLLAVMMLVSAVPFSSVTAGAADSTVEVSTWAELKKALDYTTNCSVVKVVKDIETKSLNGNTGLHQDNIIFMSMAMDKVLDLNGHTVNAYAKYYSEVAQGYLDGTTEVWKDRTSVTYGRWREPTENNPKYYQIPFKTLVQRKYSNFIAVGRMINAEQSAFGAVRVMVNLNQLGEAAGVAGAICVDSNVDICDVDSKTLQNKLKDGGSIIL